MACPNCERLRKEMEEMRESTQLREFELEEKLNHLEDKVEWANEDKENLKAELEAALKEVQRYKALLAKFGIEDTAGDSVGGSASAGTVAAVQKGDVSRLLEILRTQSELMQEMKELIMASGAPKRPTP